MSIQHYQRVLTLLPEAALLVDTSGKILAYNTGAATLFGGFESISNSLFDLLSDDTHPEIQSYLRLCARNRQPVVGSIRCNAQANPLTLTSYGAVLEPRSKDHEAIVLLRLKAKQDSSFRFLSLQKQIEDLNREIARRLHAERELKNQSNWLQVTLSSIGDGVLIADEQAKVTFLNPVAEMLTGWQLHQAMDKPVTDILNLVNEDSNAPLDNIAQKAMFEGAIVENNVEALLIDKFGEQKNIDITAAPIALDGTVEGVIIIFHNVTEKRALERQLLDRANRLELMNQRKNQFLTMLAHELRSPVSPISNATQLLKLQAKNSAEMCEPLQVIERQVGHLKRLLDEMLDVSRITSGKMKIVKRPFDLVSLLKSICCDYASQFELLGVACNVDMQTSSLWITADADRITQVVHNLFNNSLKFTPMGGTITLGLSSNQNSVTLTVSDTGLGIEESAMIDLFEPFTQGEQSLERHSGGLGLGLSLVKGIVELHGGNIKVSSEGLNRGTTFCIDLPLSQQQVQPQITPIEEPSSQLHRILVIEDDHDTANMLTQLLELMGHEVFWASSGIEGVEQAIIQLPSVIICDIGLPGLDGFGVARHIRNNVQTASIPMLALTGYGDSEFVNRAKEAGFDRHITKPANLKDIQDALRLTRNPKQVQLSS
ncbi:PAS domain-containing hybrid sensor histidine kinase/response regulator [Aliiglaciecola litoralis]